MKERPILFNGHMVRAILNGKKTQTRRVVKPQPLHCRDFPWEHATQWKADEGGEWYCAVCGNGVAPSGKCQARGIKSPYGMAGDQLWVRESFFESGHRGEACPGDCERSLWTPNGRIHYAVDGLPTISGENKWARPVGSVGRPGFTPDFGDNYWRKKPSIHMPRKHSRISLGIENVSIQRLHDITEADAEKEGVDFLRHIPDADETLTSRVLFEILWDSINKGRGFGWDTNPFVWVVEFRVVEMEG